LSQLGDRLVNDGGPERAAADRIFGTDLPVESSDERDPAGDADAPERDRWLRENVPPHYL
jgi:hypothetical protein